MILTLLSLGAPVSAAEPLVRDLGLPPGEPVSIYSECGEVTIIGWSQDRVRVEATVEGRVRDVTLEPSPYGARLEVETPARGEERCAWLTVQVPQGARIKVETGAANVRASQLVGALNFVSVSGGLAVQSKLVSVTAMTTSGDLEMELNGTVVDVETASGDVAIRGGDGLRADAASQTGAVRVSAPMAARIQLASNRGDVSFTGGIRQGGRLAMQTHTGNIAAELSGDTSASMRLESFSGGLSNDFGVEALDPGLLNLDRSLTVTTGAGDSSVWLTSFSGDVSVRKQ